MTDTVRISCSKGRYNLLSNDEQWCLRLATPHGNVSQTFDEEPPYWGGVEDALDLIEARLKSYLFSSRRDEDLQVIANIRAHLNECELLHTEGQILTVEREMKSAQERLDSLRRVAEFLRAEIAA